MTIPHNTDGTKSITLQGVFQTLSGTWAITGGSASASVTLPTIPKGTEITTVAGLHYGVPTSFYMSRKSSNFRERVTMTSGNTTLTIKTTDTADANFTYKLDRDYTPNTAYPSSSTWTVAVYTYNGATLVETKTYSYTWTIADWDLDAYYPYASYSVQAYNDVVSALGTDTAVAGYSKINVVASLSNAHGVHNATIASRVVQFQDGRTVSGANDTNHISNLINTAGSYSFTYTITDSRGLSKQYSGSYTVINSSAPTLNTFTCYRGDSSGNASDSGTYIWILTVGSCDSLNGHNSFVTSARIDSGSPATLTDSQWTYLTSSASPQSTYVVTVTIADLLRSTSYTKTIQSEDIPIVIREGGKGVGIGAYCEGEGLISVGYQFSGAIKSKGDRIFGTCNLIDMKSLEQGGLDTTYGADYPTTGALRTPNYIPISPSTTYAISWISPSGNMSARYYDLSKNYIGIGGVFTSSPSLFNTPSNCYYIRFELWHGSTTVPSEASGWQLEKGSIASPYVPYAMDNVELTDAVRNGAKIPLTMSNCTAQSAWGGCWARITNNKVHIHLGLENLVSVGTSWLWVSTLTTQLIPKNWVVGNGWSLDGSLSGNNPCVVMLDSSGNLYVCCTQYSSVIADFEYFLD